MANTKFFVLLVFVALFNIDRVLSSSPSNYNPYEEEEQEAVEVTGDLAELSTPGGQDSTKYKIPKSYLKKMSKKAIERSSPGSLLISDPLYEIKPYIFGSRKFFNGTNVLYLNNGTTLTIYSPILDSSTQDPIIIGHMPNMTKYDSELCIESSKEAWNRGQGTWPQMSAAQRIAALRRVVVGLKKIRNEIVDILMWEICKTKADAALEFDRTIIFISALIEKYKEIEATEGSWKTVSGIYARGIFST